MDKKPLIEIKNLVKKFGAFTALNGVSLDAVSYTHLRAPRDLSTSRMPSSA